MSRPHRTIRRRGLEPTLIQHRERHAEPAAAQATPVGGRADGVSELAARRAPGTSDRPPRRGRRAVRHGTSQDLCGEIVYIRS